MSLVLQDFRTVDGPPLWIRPLISPFWTHMRTWEGKESMSLKVLHKLQCRQTPVHVNYNHCQGGADLLDLSWG